MAAPWEKYAGAPEASGPWAKYRPEPTGNRPVTESAEPSFTDKALDAVVAVGKRIDSVTGAPVRSAIGAVQEGGGLSEAASAYGKQFAADSDLAPSGKQIATRAGLDATTPMSERFPSLYTDEEGLTLKAKKGGFLDVTPAGAAGLAIDIAADPTTLIPSSAIAKGARAVTKGTANTAKRAGDFLEDFAVTRAAKHAGPDSLSDFRALDKRGKLKEFGRMALDEGIVTPLASFEDVAERSAQLKQKLGKQLGDFEDALDGRFDDLTKSDLRPALFNPERAASRIEKELIEPLKKNPAMLKLIPALQEEVAALRTLGDSPVPFKRAREIKNGYDEFLNYDKTQTPAKEMIKRVRGIVNNEIENGVEQVASRTTMPEAFGRWKETKNRYGMAADMADMSNDRLLRFDANRFLSPTDYGVGAVTGTAAGLQSDDPVSGFLAGAAGAGVNKFARKYGNSVAATIADRTSGMARGGARATRQVFRAAPPADVARGAYRTEMGIRRSSEAESPTSADTALEKLTSSPGGQRYAGALSKAKERGDDAYATTFFTLQQTDPEFRKLMNDE